MKNLIKTLIVSGAVMALATASIAQSAGPRGGAGQGRPGGANGQQMMKQRQEMMNKIYDQLKLTADQKKKIEALNKDRMAKMQKMFGQGRPAGGANGRPPANDQRRAEMQKMQKDYEASLKKIMGDSKYAEYQKLLKAAREKARANRPGGGGGAGGARRGGGK
ncbi:MAG: hypothetical protein KF857_12375 [Fimbriimonadaceae bacterium]|nr:hypothetical protein [Fimbriimonadaceae bacterium]